MHIFLHIKRTKLSPLVKGWRCISTWEKGKLMPMSPPWMFTATLRILEQKVMLTGIIDISVTTEIVCLCVCSFTWKDNWNNTVLALDSYTFLILTFHLLSLDPSCWYFTFRKTHGLSIQSFRLPQISSQTKNLFSSLRDSNTNMASKVNCFLQAPQHQRNICLPLLSFGSSLWNKF